MTKGSTLFFSLLLLLLFSPFSCYADDASNASDDSSDVKHPAKSVIERKLVVEKANAKLILKENKNYAAAVEKRNFKGETLAYVTPWNNHGYDVAKIFNNKFTYVSPVWFQIKLGPKITVGGLHDIDAGWVADVRKGSNTKIVPRFLFENIHTPEAAQYAYAKVDEIKQALLDVCLNHKFDGVVLEGLAGMVSSGEDAEDFVHSIANALHAKSKIIILVISPDARSFGAAQFSTYSKFVDKFSLMTYDHSSFDRPGPVAPISWVESAVQALQVNDQANKIMLGLNFYGFDFIPSDKSGSAVVGTSYTQLLKKHNPKIYWESNSAEHSFTYKDQSDKTHAVYYPTLKSVHERIKLAERLGVSISIWEIGQGLDYFYDLL